tara:strand:+ start:50 stop:316 length:267 start_codon:yes stop_codon:yes gene_type:complete
MGGFVRSIIRRVFRPAPVVVQQPAPQPAPATAPQTKPTDPKTSGAMANMNAGAYGGSTVLTGSSGVEEEANVGKTVLGGGTPKKKKKT